MAEATRTEGQRLAEEFPRLDEVIDPRRIQFGLEWAYSLAQNINSYEKEGWKLVPGASSFEHSGQSYLVMQKGKGTTHSVAFVPQISVDVPVSSSGQKAN